MVLPTRTTTLTEMVGSFNQFETSFPSIYNSLTLIFWVLTGIILVWLAFKIFYKH